MPYLYVYQQPVSESKAIGENTSFTLLAKSEESYDWHWESKADAQSSWSATDAGTELPSGSFFHMSDVTVYGGDDPLPTIDPDEISLSIPVTAERDGHIYRCVLAGTDTVTSNEVTLTIAQAITITAQPQSASIIEGETAAFSVTAEGDNLNYQWQVSTDNGETWAGIRNAIASSYSIQGSLSESGNKYRCVVSNTSGTVESDAATLTVTEDTRLQAPVITANPSSVVAADGDTATFSVTVSGDDLSYQWQTNQNGNWYGINGATLSSYSTSAAISMNGAKYRCQVSNAAGTVYSAEATLTVTGGSSVSTPVITSQPISTTVADGVMAKFNVYASGGSLSYQWQVKRSGTWYNVSGATNQSLSVRGGTDTNGNEYRCMVSNPSGVAYSTVAVLTVRESGPTSFYGYHSIIISGKNTYGEWQMYPTSRPHVAPPEVKTAYVDIPGADGGFDYTELLNKTPNYGFRKGSWEFLLIPQERWADVYRSLVNFLHGRQHTIILEDDPNFMYTGRLSVNEWRSAAHNSLITIDYILDPDPIDTSDEHYNPDEEDLKAAGRILRKPEHSGSVIMLVDGVETIVPISSMYDDGDNILY